MRERWKPWSLNLFGSGVRPSCLYYLVSARAAQQPSTASRGPLDLDLHELSSPDDITTRCNTTISAKYTGRLCAASSLSNTYGVLLIA